MEVLLVDSVQLKTTTFFTGKVFVLFFTIFGVGVCSVFGLVTIVSEYFRDNLFFDKTWR